MYEKFKQQLLTKLSNNFKMEDLSIISQQLDLVAYDYEVTQKETAVVVYNSDLPELVKTFMVCKKMEGLSDQTLYNYGIALKKFFLTLQKSPEQITANDIRVYLYEYQNHTNISNRSLDKVRQVLSSFFVWAYKEKYIPFEPTSTIKRIKYETKQRQSLSQIELELIRESCQTPKEKAIIEFLYSTGCRISELSIVKKTDIDWDKKTVTLFGKGSKYRTSYINAKSEITLKNYLEQRTDNNLYLFVSDRKPYNQLHKAGLERIIRNIAKRTNLDIKITPHVFRHTTATTAVNNGMAIQDISKLLGHANISTTMIYAHTSEENIQTSHKKYIV